MCVVVDFSLLMHLSPFINHTDASGLGSLKKGARRRKGTCNHLGKIPGKQVVEYGCYPLCLQLLLYSCCIKQVLVAHQTQENQVTSKSKPN